MSISETHLAVSIVDIPYEVFTGTLLEYLDIPDILRLGETCQYLHNVVTDQHFWRQRTLSTFRLPPQPIRQKGWDEMYKRLSTAKVFTWGSNQFGRLGHNYEGGNGRSFLAQKVGSPTEIESLRNETVVDLGCGGWSMWALTASGKVYGWGKLEGDQFSGSTRGTPGLIGFPEVIDRIAVGRRSCLALAETGEIYTVDHDFKYISNLKLGSPDVLDELPSKQHQVIHIAAGWHYAAAVFKGLGLMVWKSDRTEDERRAVFDSATSDNSTERTYKARKVQRTEDIDNNDPASLDIIGLMVGDGYLIYLTHAGTVHRVNITDDIFDSTSPPESFCLQQFSASPQLCYLSGSFDHFGLFNTAGDVLVGDSRTEADTTPDIMQGLQHRGIIGLSWGDWHGLALCEDGSILSWGRELNANGCLGLGYTNIQEAMGMGLQYNRGEVLTPMGETRRVPGFGGQEDKFAFCVAAAGWHSAALVADFKVKEPRKREW